MFIRITAFKLWANSLEMDIQDTFDENIKDHFRSLILSANPKTALKLYAGKPDEAFHYMMIYENWRKRHIDPVPRRVHYSKTLLEHSKYKPCKAAILNHQSLFEKGGDFYPYLSRQVNKYKNILAKNSKSSSLDKDTLLNSWGIHHLHFSKQGGADLLFLYLLKDDVYFLDIADHSKFIQQNLVEIIYTNWPHLLEPYELKGVMPSENSYTDEELEELAKSGVQSLLTIDKKAYYFHDIISTSGHPLSITNKVGSFFREIEQIRQAIKNHNFEIQDKEVKSLCFSLEFGTTMWNCWNYKVIEKNIGFELQFQ